MTAIIKPSVCSWHLLPLSELCRSTEDLSLGVLQELESIGNNDNACGGFPESLDTGVLIPVESGGWGGGRMARQA